MGLFLYLTFFILTSTFGIPSLKQIINLEEFKGKIEDSIAYFQFLHTKPQTLRLIYNHSSTESTDLIQAFSKDRITFSFNVTTLFRESTNGFFSLVTLYLISPTDSLKEIFQNVAMLNIRRDKTIIISSQNHFSHLSVSKQIQILAQKLFIIPHPLTIYGDPYVYNGGEMEKITVSLFERKMGNIFFGGNLRGRKFIASSNEFPPFGFKMGEKDGVIQMGGTGYKFFSESSKIFNFTFTTLYTGLDYGTLHPNGSWTGNFANVYYNKADFTYGWAMDINSPKVDFPSFGVILNSFDLIFLTAYPKTNLKWYTFMLSFQIEVWIWTLSSFAFIFIVQFIIMWFKKGRKFTYFVWEAGTINPYSLIMEQGLTNIPSGIRYTSFILLIAGTVLGTGYKSTLRTNLAFPRPEKIPLTILELAQRTDYSTILAGLGPLETEFIQKSETKVIQELKKRLRIVHDPEICVRLAFLGPRIACMYWGPIIQQVGARLLTLNPRLNSLLVSKDVAKKMPMHIALPLDSPFTDSFRGISAGTLDSHLYTRWEMEVNYLFKKRGKKVVLKNKNSDSVIYRELLDLERRGDASERPLTLKSLRAVFYFIPLGSLMALVGFIWENVNNILHRFNMVIEYLSLLKLNRKKKPVIDALLLNSL